MINKDSNNSVGIVQAIDWNKVKLYKYDPVQSSKCLEEMIEYLLNEVEGEKLFFEQYFGSKCYYPKLDLSEECKLEENDKE